MPNKHNNDLKSLLIEELKDAFSAEQQILQALPEAIQAAESDDLKKALQQHLDETKHQVERLNKIFSILNTEAAGVTCFGMQGLIKEVKEVLQKHEKSAVKDAALISKLQRVEHYEISAYGTMRTFAKELELDDVEDLLDETLDEESAADEKLTSIAEGGMLWNGINQKANQ